MLEAVIRSAAAWRAGSTEEPIGSVIAGGTTRSPGPYGSHSLRER
jgi:hypothetical protein